MIKRTKILILLILLPLGCKNTSSSKVIEQIASKEALANTFIDAFYSYNTEKLRSTLSKASESQPEILYYQKWAGCGNYEVVRRGFVIEENDSTIIYPITVKDDLMAALDIDFNVTDTFRLTINEGRIRSVSTSSNDPDLYYAAKDWVKENRNEIIEIPCKDIWNGGPTPCECIKAMIKGFEEFKATK